MRYLKIFAAAAALGGAAWAGWEAYKELSAPLARTAEKTDRRRVAVLGFSSENGKATKSSAIVTERLTSEMAANPRLEVIERGRLDEVLKEQKLGAKGVVDPATAKRIGNILGADAVVTGTVIELDDKNVEVNARLVDTGNAQILKAASKTVKKDWEEKKDGWKDFDFDMSVDMDAPASLLPPGFMEDETCRKMYPEDVDLTKMTVALKAKRTAHALKSGELKLDQLKKNPGAEISDQDLKHSYYAKIKEWYYSPDLRALTPQEEEVVRTGEPLLAKYPCR